MVCIWPSNQRATIGFYKNHRVLQEPIHVIQDLNMYTYGLIYIVRERERENRLITRNLELNFQIHIYSITLIWQHWSKLILPLCDSACLQDPLHCSHCVFMIHLQHLKHSQSYFLGKVNVCVSLVPQVPQNASYMSACTHHRGAGFTSTVPSWNCRVLW